MTTADVGSHGDQHGERHAVRDGDDEQAPGLHVPSRVHRLVRHHRSHTDENKQEERDELRQRALERVRAGGLVPFSERHLHVSPLSVLTIHTKKPHTCAKYFCSSLGCRSPKTGTLKQRKENGCVREQQARRALIHQPLRKVLEFQAWVMEIIWHVHSWSDDFFPGDESTMLPLGE